MTPHLHGKCFFILSTPRLLNGIAGGHLETRSYSYVQPSMTGPGPLVWSESDSEVADIMMQDCTTRR